MQCLRRGDSDALEGRCDPGEQSIDTATERRCADGHSEGNEDDKHGILGGAGTALVSAKPIDQTAHLKVPSTGGVRPYGQHAPIASATQPMPTLAVFHQCGVHLGVRIASLDIILLDFDAIAGEFVSVGD